MLNTLLLSLSLSPSFAGTTAAQEQAEPAIRVWLNADGYFDRGDRAKVYLRPAADGYLVVIRADPQGRIRVLFPLEPGPDQAVRAGKKLEIKGRGDRPAFTVDDSVGQGLILAAVSARPFRLDQFSRAGHWDFRALAAEPMGEDPESGLLALVQRMVGDAPFDYDVAPYWVSDRYADRPYGAAGHPFYPRPYAAYPFGFRSRFYFGLGSPYYYDPFYYGPGYRWRPFGYWR